MTKNEIFSVMRFGHLLRKDAYDSYRATAVGVGAAAAVILVIYGITAYARDVNVYIGSGFATGAIHPFHIAMLSIILFLGGPIISSRVFREMHDRIKNHDWMMFPASTLEKFTERWFVSGIVFSVSALFGYFVVTSAYAGISELILGRSVPIFNPFSTELWLMIAHYLVAHTLFILGAAYFRKNHFLKTVLSVVLLSMSFAIISAVLFRIVYWELFRELFINGGASQLARLEIGSDALLGSLIGDKAESFGRVAATTAQVIYWTVFGPLCLTVAYFRIRETEVKDGV